MDWLPLASSVLAAAAYDSVAQTLYLRFHSGYDYRYFEFPAERFQQFLAAESHGRYFSNHIRNRFVCERMNRVHRGGLGTH